MFKSKLLGLIAGLVLVFSAQAQISGSTIPVICSDGTAASPCFTFTSAVNKGFWSPTAGTIGIAIGGVNVGTWSSTGYTGTGSASAASYFANGGSVVGTSVSGVQIANPTALGYPTYDMVDTARTANNKIVGFRWTGGQFDVRFMNDAYNSGAAFLSVTGGQAAGITGITSNSGSGAWTHTGNFVVGASANFSITTGSGGYGYTFGVPGTNQFGAIFTTFSSADLVLANFVRGSNAADSYVSSYGGAGFGKTVVRLVNSDSSIRFLTSPIATIAEGNAVTMVEQLRISHTATAVNYHEFTGGATANPAIHKATGTDTNVSLEFWSKGTGSFNFYTNAGAVRQVEIVHTAGATNRLTLTGSNGGNPLIGISGGTALALTSTNLVVGTSAFLRAGVSFSGAVTTTGTAIDIGTEFEQTVTVQANSNAAGVAFGGSNAMTLNKAGSGTHTDMIGVYINPPVIGAGAAALTNTTTLKINGPPVTGTNLRSIWVTSGVSELAGVRLTGFTFANIATNIPNNGDIGYCSDCTLANPCAGGGTGALAKRLNGVNVCN